MPERDYAKPLRRSRKSLIWKFITRDHRSSVDWKSATPLTPALRERFPDLLSDQSSNDNVLPVPVTSAVFETDGRTLASNDQRHSRNDSAQVGISHNPPRQNTQHSPPSIRHHEPSSFSAPSNPLLSQREHGSPGSQHIVTPTHQQHDYSPSPSRPTGHLGNQNPPPSSSTLQSASSSHVTGNIRCLRDSQGRLCPVPSLPHRTDREPSLRRQPATRSSPREQILQEESSPGRHRSTTDSISSTTVITGYIRHARFQTYSAATESHTSPQSQQSSTEARLASYGYSQAHLSPRSLESRCQDIHHPTIAELQESTDGRTVDHLDPNELVEVDELLTPLALPTIPYAHHPLADRTVSTTSIATSAVTLGNRSAASRSCPRTLMGAHFRGAAHVVGFKDTRKSKRRWRSLKAKFVKYGNKIESKARAVWDAHEDERKLLVCMFDVLWSGELDDCQCKACLYITGLPWRGGTHYHEVPKGGWPKMTPPVYQKLKQGVEGISDPTAFHRCLVAFRRGPDYREVRYVNERMDLDA